MSQSFKTASQVSEWQSQAGGLTAGQAVAAKDAPPEVTAATLERDVRVNHVILGKRAFSPGWVTFAHLKYAVAVLPVKSYACTFVIFCCYGALAGLSSACFQSTGSFTFSAQLLPGFLSFPARRVREFSASRLAYFL